MGRALARPSYLPHCSDQLAFPAQLAPSAQLATSETEVCTTGAGAGAGAAFDGAAAAGPAATAAIAAATTSATLPLFPNAVLTIFPSLSCTAPPCIPQWIRTSEPTFVAPRACCVPLQGEARKRFTPSRD